MELLGLLTVLCAVFVGSATFVYLIVLLVQHIRSDRSSREVVREREMRLAATSVPSEDTLHKLMNELFEARKKESALNADMIKLMESSLPDSVEQDRMIGRIAQLENQVCDANAQVALLTRERDDQKRRADEFFGIIEAVLKERDQWRSMWDVHGREHLEAQNLLEHALMEARGVAKSALVAVNQYRKAAGQEPLAFGVEPGERPVGSAKRFADLLERARAEAPPSVDGISLRTIADHATASTRAVVSSSP